jgi:hypothetical protein
MDQLTAREMMKQCIGIVRKAQLPDGGFLHQSSPAQDFSRGAVVYKTTFFAANILACLNSVATIAPAVDNLADIRAPAARFLLAQKSDHWSFNYWARDTVEVKTMPYPDDLDDTFVALAALHGYNPALIDGAVLAQVAKMLTAVEAAPGGPYRTWLVATAAAAPGTPPDSKAAPPDKWRDVDLVVNSNIGYFLSRVGVRLSNLERFVRERVERGNLYSPYYPGSCPVEYFTSRFLGSASAPPPVDVERLFARGEFDRPQPFCIDPSRDGKMCYAGSSALTAAFCAEALASRLSQFSQAPQISSSSWHHRPPAIPAATLLERAKMTARGRCYRLPESLKAITLREIEATNAGEMVMVPYAMHHALGNPQTVSRRRLDDLALANLYGWMAYTIYDDVLDGDKDEQQTRLKLSGANFFLRELTAYYIQLENEIPGIGEYFWQLLDGIDSANAEEQERVGGIAVDRLADRSLGHALPALAVLFASGAARMGSAAAAKITETTLSFFRNYLIARQLHDDAHDWSDDLARGRLNSAGARLMAIHSTGEQGDPIDLKKFFWREAIPAIVADIKKYLNQARADLAVLQSMGIIRDQAPLEEWLMRLEAAAGRAIRERDEVEKFIAAFT